ncbi:hypothetical protein IFO22_004404 [Salmonella enterica]|nr:hypothetical protein [Salmonella enterica]
MQGKRKRRHLHPVAVYLKGIIRRLPVVFRLIFRRQTVQPAPAFLLRCGFGDALASSAFRPADELRVLITVFAFLASAWYSIVQYRKEKHFRS